MNSKKTTFRQLVVSLLKTNGMTRNLKSSVMGRESGRGYHKEMIGAMADFSGAMRTRNNGLTSLRNKVKISLFIQNYVLKQK